MKKAQNINEITIEYIMNYCKENNKVEWLKSLARETEMRTKKTKVMAADENGEMQEREVAEEVEQPISFISLRARFVDECMPEIKKGSKKKTTFRDLIEAM